MPATLTLTSAAASFRQFNRAYTRFLGTLSDSYLSTEFSLAEGRVLYELATHAGPQAKEVAETLGLDAGYLSRILSKFEKAGLVVRATAAHDNRATNLLLTARGKAAVRKLNLRADKQAHAILAGLSENQRAKFSSALATIGQTVLGQKIDPSSVILRSHRPGDMGAIVSLEGSGYVEQFGWDNSFEALVARIVADFIAAYDPDREHCWIAEVDGQHLGHVFLVQHPDEPDTAKLRLLYVDPAARGLGLGHKLVAECVSFARAAHYRKITLWTQSILTAAHRIYQAAGFRLVNEQPHHSFGKDLVGQTWELDLL
ncbi:MAG TPA: helix-turn-helix domain-containing GNAT family N-acetyltransferase [Terracidiphilus sp.]|jgi:DNA-binding MarR family transcriptional regulator/GNAT superfamily N-acetyltransferase|nr:helix-turn-helix domain-containing GNAT family N-acetyltransferase [Terracidiphilus sp.]